MPTKSLLDKARESARCARERAHKRLMWGGQMQQQEEIGRGSCREKV